MSPRLRLDKDNFKTVKNQHDDTYYEENIMQEMLQRSYITQHPTSGYNTATMEIKRVYDGFEVKNYLGKVQKKKKTKETEEEGEKTWLQKLLSISWHCAPTFSENLKQQNFNTLRDEGWDEAQVQHCNNNMNKLYGLPKYWSYTQYYHNGLWTLGHYLEQYHRATWRTLQTTDMATTTSIR
eukprot:18293-Amphidinium_carterae.1